MKELIQPLYMAVLFTILFGGAAYLLFSFVFIEIDFRNWPMKARVFNGLIAGLTYLIGFAIYLKVPEETV